MTIIWYMVLEILSVMYRIFCHFGIFFVLLPPPNNSKNQNFEKMKITPGDIIILHMCTINDNHMMFGSLYLDVRDGQKFLSFWTIFCPFTPVKTWKIKIFEKWKNRLEISSFYTNVTKMIIICYIVPEIRCKMGCKVILIFYFGLFYGLLPPPWLKKSKFYRNEKHSCRSHHSTHVLAPPTNMKGVIIG